MNKDDLKNSIEDIPNVSDVIIDSEKKNEKKDDGRFEFSFKIKNSKYYCVGVYSADKKRIKWLEVNALMRAKDSLGINDRFKVINHVNKTDEFGCSTSYIEEISAFIITSNMLVLPKSFYVPENRVSAYKIMIMEAIVSIYGAIKNLKEETSKCFNEESLSKEDENNLSQEIKSHE